MFDPNRKLVKNGDRFFLHPPPHELVIFKKVTTPKKMGLRNRCRLPYLGLCTPLHYITLFTSLALCASAIIYAQLPPTVRPTIF